MLGAFALIATAALIIIILAATGLYLLVLAASNPEVGLLAMLVLGLAVIMIIGGQT